MDGDRSVAAADDVTPASGHRLTRARRILAGAVIVGVGAAAATLGYGAGQTSTTRQITDLQTKVDDQTGRLRRQGRSLEAATAAIDGLTQQLRTRASNAQHVICTDELLRALLPPAIGYLTTPATDPTSTELRRRFLEATVALQAGLDPATGACPPLPLPAN